MKCPCHDPTVFGHRTTTCQYYETQPGYHSVAPPEEPRTEMLTLLTPATWDEVALMHMRLPVDPPPRHG